MERTLRGSHITLEIVARPDIDRADPLNATLIHIYTSDLSGMWSETLSTEYSLAASFVALFDDWAEHLAHWSGQGTLKQRDAHPLEGRFRLSLTSTPDGQAVVVALPVGPWSPTTPVTTVPVTVEDLRAFSSALHAMLDGSALFARLGKPAGSWPDFASAPAALIQPTALTLFSPHLVRIPLNAAISEDDLSQARYRLEQLRSSAVDGSSSTLLDTGELRLDVEMYGPEDRPFMGRDGETGYLAHLRLRSDEGDARWLIWMQEDEVERVLTGADLNELGLHLPAEPFLLLWAAQPTMGTA